MHTFRTVILAFGGMLESDGEVREFYAHSPSILLAFARIFAAEAADSFPRLTICVAGALALAAWARSSIGNFLSAGMANLEVGIFLRAAVVSFAIV